jgi:hypothetical protein
MRSSCTAWLRRSPDKSGAYTAAVRGFVADSGRPIGLGNRSISTNLLSKIMLPLSAEPRPMLGFKKGQMRCTMGLAVSPSLRVEFAGGISRFELVQGVLASRLWRMQQVIEHLASVEHASVNLP